MIYSNLLGTTSNQFKVNGDGTGQILSNNAYDLFWACSNPITNSANPNVKLLPSGANLDDYRLFVHMGQWYSTIEITETLINLPEEVIAEFTLLILTNSGNWDGYLRQEIVTNDGVKFERRFNGFKIPSWSAWKRVAYAPEMGRFTLVPYDGGFGQSGDVTGISFTKQRNRYYIISNIVFIYLSFTMERLNTPAMTGPLSFKGLPIPMANYGADIFGVLSMTGTINNINTVPVLISPTEPYGGVPAADAFSLLLYYNSSSDRVILKSSYVYVSDVTVNNPVKVTGGITIYNTVNL